MRANVKALLGRWRHSFLSQKIMCRLFAAVCGSFVYVTDKYQVFYYPEPEQTPAIWSVAVCIMFLFVLYSLVHILWPFCETDKWLLMMGATICVGQWLLSVGGLPDRFCFLMAATIGYSLLCSWFIRNAPEELHKWKPSGRCVWIMSAVLGVVCGGVIATTTCYRYATFSAPNFDFGLFVNMFYHMKEGGLPLCTSERDVLLSHFSVHISPVYYLLLPFYVIFPSPLTLQIGQAVVAASGIVPMVLLCRRRMLSEKYTVIMAFLYACYPVLTTGCHYDLHENCFLTPLLLWLFYSCECLKYRWACVCAVLVFSVKEDAAVYIAIFAVYLFVSGENRKLGFLLFALSVIYFGVALWVLQTRSAYYAQFYVDSTPNPSIDGPMIERYGNLIFDSNDGLLGVVQTVFTNPGYLLTQVFGTTDSQGGKITYFLQLFLPIGFLPFWTHKSSRWILMTPVLLNLLTQYPYQYDIGFQYHFGIAAFLLYASVINVAEINVSNRRVMLGVAVANCLCLYLLYALQPCLQYCKNWEENKVTYIQMEQLLGSVPADASVTCSTFLLAHMADRNEIYELEYHGISNDVDYVVLDARQPVEDLIDDWLAEGYSVKENHPGLLVILEKNEKTADTR